MQSAAIVLIINAGN